MLNATPTPSVPKINAGYDNWVADDNLDDDSRLVLRTFTTPRRGFGGQTCWPVDEVSGNE